MQDHTKRQSITKSSVTEAAATLGRKGGHARAARLSSEERSEIARKAARARWARHVTPVVAVGLALIGALFGTAHQAVADSGSWPAPVLTASVSCDAGTPTYTIVAAVVTNSGVGDDTVRGFLDEELAGANSITYLIGGVSGYGSLPVPIPVYPTPGETVEMTWSTTSPAAWINWFISIDGANPTTTLTPSGYPACPTPTPAPTATPTAVPTPPPTPVGAAAPTNTPAPTSAPARNQATATAAPRSTPPPAVPPAIAEGSPSPTAASVAAPSPTPTSAPAITSVRTPTSRGGLGGWAIGLGLAVLVVLGGSLAFAARRWRQVRV